MVSLPCLKSRPDPEEVISLLYLFLTVAVWLLDRWSKQLVVRHLPLWSSRPLLGRLLSLTHVHNTGAAFGLLQNQVLPLSLISIGLLLSLFFLRRHIAMLGLGGRIGVALIVGGALGNLYDRVACGYVIDFLELPYWPVFNLADSFVVLGVGLLMLSIWDFEQGGRQGAASPTKSD